MDFVKNEVNDQLIQLKQLVAQPRQVRTASTQRLDAVCMGVLCRLHFRC